ncbi:MAG: hypothetical protein ABR591_08635 [Candidatus Velthaea sp.]
MIVLLATLFMSLGLLNLDFSRGWWRGQARRLIIGMPVVLVYVYATMPALVFPQAITLLLLTLVPNAVYSLALAARTVVVSRRIVSIRRTPLWPYLIALGMLGAYALVLVVAPVVDAGGLRDLARASISTSAAPSAELQHVRVVPEEAAIFAGNKVVGQLGAYYRVGTYNIQAQNGSLVWVAPLNFQGPIQWLARRNSPGVIVVSAENPDTPAELRMRSPMHYIPSALFNDNIERHVYMRYGLEAILETTLQLDDKGDPKYLCTLGRPTIGWTGPRVTAVVIVDPATGAMQRVARADFAALPAWVSRVYPPEVVLAYNDWFGRYVHGWWNAQLAKRDVHLPARPEVFGLLVAGARFVWFVDHTSPNATDDSMTGFTYTDSRSGDMTYYTSSGGQFNSAAAERSVGANPIVRQARLVPTQPILYNAFRENTWVVPIVADNGKFQSLALVQAAGGHVVVGNTAAPSPATDAFGSYGSYLGDRTAGGGPSMQRVAGTIDRFGNGGGRIYFTLRERRGIFTIADAGDPNVLLARPGDRVSFEAIPDAGGLLSVRSLRDDSIHR